MDLAKASPSIWQRGTIWETGETGETDEKCWCYCAFLVLSWIKRSPYQFRRSNSSRMNRADSVKGSNINDDPLTHRIIGAAIEVHRLLGPGLLESTYEECLCFELTLVGIPFERQIPLPIVYKSMTLLRAYKPDLLVDHAVIVELKTVEKILPVHEAQMLTYLRLSGLERGLLLNFNCVPLKAGIRRLNKSKFSPVSRVSPASPLSPSPSNSSVSKSDQTV
jgi:GxxExxY protein